MSPSPYLREGDCIEVMAGLDEASVDAVVTDPPYGISFMGKHWDRFAIEERVGKRDVSKLGVRLTGGHETPNRKLRARTGSAYANAAGIAGAYDFTANGNRAFQAWCEQWATECLRVLKPGGHLLSFGGTRTYHRLASGVEDAGFEVRDCIAWMFGSGFPKSLNLDGEREGWGTALKPAHEPIVVARKPLVGTVAANVLKHGTGALNVDGCRIGTTKDVPASPRRAEQGAAYGDLSKSRGDEPGFDPNVGRWPANVVLDEEAAEQLDQQAGERRAGGSLSGDEPSRPFATCYGEMNGRREWESYGDSGGPSRFFYCAKTSRAERNAGLDGFAATKRSDEGYGTIQQPKLDRAAPRENWQPHVTANNHPTVKPISLMRWLARLVTPPAGLILDPFLGSGTTGIAAALEGFEFVGIEREPDYLKIADARIAFWIEHGEDGLRIVAEREAAQQKREVIAASGQLSLEAEVA